MATSGLKFGPQILEVSDKDIHRSNIHLQKKIIMKYLQPNSVLNIT